MDKYELAELGEIAKVYAEYRATGQPFSERVGARRAKRFLGVPLGRDKPGRLVTRTPVEMRDDNGGTWFANLSGELKPGYAKRVDKFTLPKGKEVRVEPDYRGSR
jgi:hypothetical protein